MVTLVNTSAQNAQRAQERLAAVMPYGMAGEKTLFHYWQEHLICSNTVCIDGQPAFIVFWHRGLDCSLIINGVASIQDGADRSDALYAGFEELAKVAQCSSIIFHSTRAGMARKAEKFGFLPWTVAYRKDLSHG